MRFVNCAVVRARSFSSRAIVAIQASARLSVAAMLPDSMDRAAKRILNTACSFALSRQLSVTTVFRKDSSTSISLWLNAVRVRQVKTF